MLFLLGFLYEYHHFFKSRGSFLFMMLAQARGFVYEGKIRSNFPYLSPYSTTAP